MHPYTTTDNIRVVYLGN